MSYTLNNQGTEIPDDLRIHPREENIHEMLNFQRKRVLLIEDDRTTRRLVQATIGDRCHLTEAESAGSGITKYINFDPDVVFLDLNLPDGNGHNILEWIVKNDPAAYVVIFSGSDNPYNIKKAISNGAKGFVKKPFDPDMMIYHICHSPHIH